MLKYYVRHSVAEEFQRVSTPPRENAWVHGDNVTESDLQELARTYDMDQNILKDVLDKDELPRVEIRDNGELYVFVRTIWRGRHGQVLTTPLLLAVKGTVFASMAASSTDGHRLASPATVAGTDGTTSLLLGTLAAVVSDYQELMLHTSHVIHDTGTRLRTHEVTNQDFIRFVTVEDNLNEYRLNLSGMVVVAERLKEVLRTREDTEAIEDIILYIKQLIVATESHSQSITSIRNAYSTIANNTLNQRMKTLTVLTLLVALPNVFYGMYGMNIALPFADEPWAYSGILGFTIMVIVLVYVLAKKRGIF
ncbi:MAG TPA: CorA family divalent cation transporter [Candidatus Saccharimonadales bacterium]|nr:CorA family divalent cation transporter [Candidatus Saccharimonadales bacterium]